MTTILYFLIGLLIGMVSHRKEWTGDDISIAIVIALLWVIAVPIWVACHLIKYNSRG